MVDCLIIVCVFRIVFVVQLNFTLKIFNRNQIEIRLNSSLPSVMCVTRLTPRTNLIDTQVRFNAEKQNLL